MKDSKTLASASVGRDNNLNLMRVIAAMLVLLSHSFTVATGDSSSEPGRLQLGLTLGDFAVDIFFVMSGYLVTKSITRSQSLRHYALARGFRIFPGLWIALAISTAIVCVWFTSAPLSHNLLDLEVWRYVLKNAIVVTGPVFGFPGAFSGNPYPASVNASLWTLPLELWMYIVLAIAWVLSRLLPWKRPDNFQNMVRALAVVLTVAAIGCVAIGHPSNSLRHASMFYIAACLYGFQDRVPLRGAAFVTVLAMLLGAAFLPRLAFEVPYRLLVPYLVLYVAFIPGGFVRRYNCVGDYSYGIYIYAFPIQQMCAASFPGISVLRLFLLSGALTVVCAMLSWHLIEKAAMQWRVRKESRALAG